MSISFNGTTSKLSGAMQIATGYPVSIFCWIKPTSAGTGGMAVGTGKSGGAQENAVYHDGAATKIKAFTNDGGSTNAASTTNAQTTWQPALAVFVSTGSGGRTIYYAGGAAVNDPTPANGFSVAHDIFRVGVRAISDTLFFTGDIAEVAVWNSVLTQSDFNSLAAGAVPNTVATGSLVEYWSLTTQGATQTGQNGRVLTATSTSQGATHPITGPATVFGNVTADDAVAAGSFISVVPGTLSGNITADNAVAAGILGQLPGVLTTPPLKNNTGTLLASVTGVAVNVYSASTGLFVTRQTGLTSNSSGIVTITDASLTPGTSYAYEVDLSAAGLGRRLPVGVAA